jgi:hypothetical protein
MFSPALEVPGNFFLPLEPADHALQELARFGHDEAKAVDVGEDFEQLIAVEMLDGFCQLAALLQGADEIQPGLGATSGESIFLRILHGCILQSYELIRAGR